jgi:8-oxo-dGTP pyrophosphatase MutT (NUDIX family)
MRLAAARCVAETLHPRFRWGRRCPRAYADRVKLPVPIRRLIYRCGYRVLQVVWFVWRPAKTGVKCLLTADDRILLVRHTYGRRRWDLPGGSVKRGEPPLQTARREMDEELGLGCAEWIKIGEIRGTFDHRRDTIHCFRAEIEPSARLKLDRGELDAAAWFARTDLPADLSPYVVPVVEGARAYDVPRQA